MKIIATSLLGALALTTFATAGQKKDIVDTAVGAGTFKTLVAAVQAADLVEALKGEGPFTVFAPTDEAFSKLPKGTVESLLKPENKDKLVDILTYHVVSGKVSAKKALKLDKATALNKKDLKLEVKGESLFINSSKVIKTNIRCTNGIIHVIDAVLLPPAEKETSAVSAAHLMSQAIHKGVNLFNEGNHGACADVYEKTAKTVLEMEKCSVSCGNRAALMTALKHSAATQCDTVRAWTMRRALDRAMMTSN